MAGSEWVIDTWVLETASGTGDKMFDAVLFLGEVLMRHAVALDHEGEIRREYQNHIRPGTPASQWWQRLWAQGGKVAFYSGRVPNAHRRQLINELHFDQSDLKFVGVAYNTPDRLLVAEESDYTAEVKAYLSSSMGIITFDRADALQRARL